MFPALPPNKFSCRWTGLVRVTETGTYRFRVTSDDSSVIRMKGATAKSARTMDPPEILFHRPGTEPAE